MMKQKNTKENAYHFKPQFILPVFLGTCILLGCSACAPIVEPSLVKEGDAIEVPNLIGTWKSVRQDKRNPQEIFWTFTKSDEGHTFVNAICADPNSSARSHISATASFTKLKDGKLYAEYDGRLVETNDKGDIESTTPLRSIARIRIVKGWVEITPLNLALNLLKVLLIQENVSFEENKGRIHINCSSDVLRKFVIKHSHLLFQNKEEFRYRLRKIETKPEFAMRE